MIQTGNKIGIRGPRWNPWPAAIVTYFVVFIAAMATWVVYASRQRVELVRKDYYEKEMLFQQQIDATRRGKGTGMSVNFDAAQQAITIRLPSSTFAATSGMIHLYRPNDAGLDRDVPMKLAADGIQRVGAKNLAPGLWKVSVSWQLNGENYSFEQSLVIMGKS